MYLTRVKFQGLLIFILIYVTQGTQLSMQWIQSAISTEGVSFLSSPHFGKWSGICNTVVRLAFLTLWNGVRPQKKCGIYQLPVAANSFKQCGGTFSNIHQYWQATGRWSPSSLDTCLQMPIYPAQSTPWLLMSNKSRHQRLRYSPSYFYDVSKDTVLSLMAETDKMPKCYTTKD